MKPTFLVAIALVMPQLAQAQHITGEWVQRPPLPGAYVGLQGSLNLMFASPQNAIPIGFAAGGAIGYDFVGFRAEVEGAYRGNTIGQVGLLANLLYDFDAGAAVTPYAGVGAGVAFVGADASGSAQFAYQGIAGVAWNADDHLRLGLEGRYFGTTNPSIGSTSWSNSQVAIMASVRMKLGSWKRGLTVEAVHWGEQPSYLVFFDWDRWTLSTQALGAVQQAASSFKRRGSARISVTGHTDRSGPQAYNRALSLRRANAVKDALVREGVAADSIDVVGEGDAQPIVTWATGPEPQNRRVVITFR